MVTSIGVRRKPLAKVKYLQSSDLGATRRSPPRDSAIQARDPTLMGPAVKVGKSKTSKHL